MIRKTLSVLIIVLAMFISCEKFNDPPSYSYTEPISANDEFEVSSLTAEGMDENLITRLTTKILHEEFKRIDAMLILRNNKVVYENYFHGYSSDIMHNTYSAAKSITSILTGIAIDKGFISDVSKPIAEYLPEYKSFSNPDPRKQNITIENLLNMNAGWDCDDWNKDTETAMSGSDDCVKFMLDLPMINNPGTTGVYCTGNVVTLGRIIENRSKMSLEQFANLYLFEPIGIRNYKWSYGNDGKIFGGGKLFLRPRDMAKIGLLMLNAGRWDDEQVVSETWAAKSSENLIKLPGPFTGYGYLWWKQTFENNTEVYFASGNGGQDIFIIPSKNMVIVFTTGNKNTSLGLQNINMIWNYILPAVQ